MGRFAPNEFLYCGPIAHALLTDPAFRHWFLQETKFADCARAAVPLTAEHASCRTTPNSQKWFWFNCFCPLDRSCLCRIETGIETDILLIFAAPDRPRFAVHIEVKRPGENFNPGQAESYPRRARCWATDSTRPSTVPRHHDFVTVAVCDERAKADPRSRAFDDVVLHADIAKKIAPYPDITDARLD